MFFVKFMDKVNRIVSMLLSLIFGVMVLVIFFQVLIRFVFPYLGIQLNFPWTEELARYLMIWSVFLGGALATRRGQLLAVDAIVFALPSLPGRIVKFFAHFVSLLFFISLVFIGIEFAQYGVSISAPGLRISMTYLYSSMVVGAVLMILNTIALLIDSFINKKDIRYPAK
ncbi:MAG TPA: TRAP transporter small permease [Virgibacillus sp.]|nr:TRAP transporter small permease [Virgibacillus sp.]